MLDLMETSTRSLAKIDQLENTNINHLKDTLNEMDVWFSLLIVLASDCLPEERDS